MRVAKKNRGDAMIMVIIIIAFVSILVSSLLMLTLTNIQMKSVDLKAKENFYSAEGALEQIQLGLQEEMAEASKIAYNNVLQNYITYSTEIARRTQFTTSFLANLENQIKVVGVIGENKYNLDTLKGYLSDEIRGNTDLSSVHDCELVKDADSLILKGLVVTYENAEGYTSVIETDIRLTVPNPNFVQPADMPDVFEYSIIANKQLDVPNTGPIDVNANVYVGENGMNLSTGANWSIRDAARMIVSGQVNVANNAELSTSSDMDFWAAGIEVSGGAMDLKGKTYVADDLLMNASGSNVALEGEYYGFGNGDSFSADGTLHIGGGDSSAILVNGTNTTLDMAGLRKLLLSGSARIATGSVYHESEEVELPPGSSNNSPGTSIPTEQPIVLQPIRVKEGIYELYSVHAGKLVTAGSSQSDDDYLLHPKTARESATNKDRYELIYNNDGTVYLKNVNSKRNVSFTTDKDLLRANAYVINANTKYNIYLVTNGPDYMKDKFVIQSVANGKFLNVEEGLYGYDYLVAANKEEVQGTSSLFELETVISAPVYTVMNEDSNQTTFKISYPNITGASMSYKTSSWGSTKTVQMTRIEGKDTYYCTISTIKSNTSYTFNYKIGSTSGSVTIQYDGSRTNTGNSANPQNEASFKDGIYAISSTSGYAVIGDEQGSLSFPYEVRFNANSIEDEIILWNNTDGTISFRTNPNDSSQALYLSVLDSGKLVAASRIMGSKEKFYIEYHSSPNYYIIRSAYSNQYVYVDTNKLGNPAYLTTEKSSATKFRFDFLQYTRAVPVETPDGGQAPEIEETPEQGEIVEVTGENKDVLLGEALEVKSNQIAYLVPTECIGVNEGETFIGKNPMTAEEYALMMSYDSDEEEYPNFEVVSFTKEVEGLGKTLGSYRTEGTTGYQTVFQTIPGENTLVYFYVSFDSDNLSQYFRDYYVAHGATLDNYMSYYVDEIALNDQFARLTLKGNMVYSQENASGGLSIVSNEGVGANLTEEEKNSLKEEELGYQKSFFALSKKLVMDYGDLSSAERTKDLYHNLIRDNAFAGMGAGVNTYVNDTDIASAIAINNAGDSAYVYEGDISKKICLIIASGDVVINQDFSGIVIAGGTVTVNSPCKITSNRDKLNKILQTEVPETGKTIIETFFINGERYVLEDASVVVSRGDTISYSDLITYEGWTKR